MTHLLALMFALGLSGAAVSCKSAPEGESSVEQSEGSDRADDGKGQPASGDKESVRLTQGAVTLVAGHRVGVFYVVERKVKLAIEPESESSEEQGRDEVVEVGGTVKIGDRVFILTRTDTSADPPYAILTAR